MATSGNFFSRRPHLLPSLIAAAMLLGALGKWPYGYYQLMRWVVCAVAVFVAYGSSTYKQTWGIWVFAFVAVLFNPLVPIHLKRDAWQVIDVMTAAVFLVGLVVLHLPTTGKADEMKGRP